MARHRYLIRYSNGFKRHVSRQERDMLIASLQQIAPREYLCTSSIQQDLEQTKGPNFLPGFFLFELKTKRRKELMETPKGLIQRLERTRVLQLT